MTLFGVQRRGREYQFLLGNNHHSTSTFVELVSPSLPPPYMKQFTPRLLEWFSHHKRSFPWRGESDPYRIWISEVMSHQTQIDRVADKFYPRFIEAFPTLESLAKATWEEVFPVWEGLGYYTRGRNMIKTAQAVMERYGGKFPKDVHELQSLPGIGAYTAAAIMSFAHDEKIPAVDTNISKIIQTLWPDEDLFEVAQSLINLAPSGRDWNGAMMDLATELRAGKEIAPPLDEYFPPEVRSQFIPVKKPKKAPKKKEKRKYCIEVGVACIWRSDGKYLIQSRPEGKSFVGHWEFPGGKREKGEDFRTCVKREVEEEVGVKVSVRPHFHEELCLFKRANLKLRFHRCQIQSGEPQPLEKQELKWAHPDEFAGIQFLKTNGVALQKLREMRT